MESNTNALNNLSLKSDSHNGNNKYRQTNNAIIGGGGGAAAAAANNGGTDASRMLEAALQHMDGIIAGKMSLSMPFFPIHRHGPHKHWHYINGFSIQ